MYTPLYVYTVFTKCIGLGSGAPRSVGESFSRRSGWQSPSDSGSCARPDAQGAAGFAGQPKRSPSPGGKQTITM